MKTNFLRKLTLLLLICIGLTNCTDPYKLQTDTFEDALVVEANLTNVLEKQSVTLSRTYRFEDEFPVFEENAVVYITDSDGTQYDFIPGNKVYTSVDAFQALPGKQYQLTIITSDGKKYTSTKEVLPAVNNMNALTASVQTVDNKRGVEIRVKSYDPTGSSQYYRYEYEETYKIISPKWISFRAQVTGPRSFTMVPRTEEARVCYSTDKSTGILLTNTTETPEDRVDFPVRFISDQNYIISHRYSILVRQYVQNVHAYNYYKTLKKLSGSGNILSPTQPGYLVGNIRSVTNPTEKVLGFFDVTSVSSKRIFFNYADLFPGEPLPPFKVNCNELIIDFCFTDTNEICPKSKSIADFQYLVYNTMGVYKFETAPTYIFVPIPCADCTSFSSNIIPPFWE